MKTKKNYCCLCLKTHLLSGEGTAINSDILVLLKFLIVNLNVSALENCTLCNDCLKSILDACDCKRKNSARYKKVHSESPTCQICDKKLEQGKTFSLVDCLTQTDWSDFVTCLFANIDLKTFENSQICGSCRMNVSNIENILKLICVYKQSNIEVKQEVEDDKTCIVNVLQDNVIEDDKTKIENGLEGNKMETIYTDSSDDNNYISYLDFKCKNEEVDLKMECDDDDNGQLIKQYEKVVDGNNHSSPSYEENKVSETTNKNNMLEQELVKDPKQYKSQYNLRERSNSSSLIKHIKIHKDSPHLQCTLCSTNTIIYQCDKCNYKTTRKFGLANHKLLHGTNETYKCQQCRFTTFNKDILKEHSKVHRKKEIKCPLCSKKFKCQDSRLTHLKLHHIGKILKCNECSYKTANKSDMMKHRKKHVHDARHNVQESFQTYKCSQCSYKTYQSIRLIEHMKTHADFKCISCSETFFTNAALDYHLMSVHNFRDTSKIHECNATVRKDQFRRHQLKQNSITEMVIVGRVAWDHTYTSKVPVFVRMVPRTITYCPPLSKDLTDKNDITKLQLENVNSLKLVA